MNLECDDQPEENGAHEHEKKGVAKLLFDIVILLTRLNVEFKTRAFEKKFPQVSPNHISVAGFVLDLVYDTSLIYLESQGIKLSKAQKISLLAAKTGINVFDMVDGALARAKVVAGKPHDSEFGLRLDTALDRFATTSDAISKVVLLYFQEKDFAKLTLELLTIVGQLLTDPLPSIANAEAKSVRHETKKEGNTLFGFGGSQIFRRIRMSIITLFPWIDISVSQLPTGFTTGWFGIWANISQANMRKAVANDPNYPETLSHEAQEASIQSRKDLGFIRIITTTLGLSTVAAVAYLRYFEDRAGKDGGEHSLLN